MKRSEEANQLCQKWEGYHDLLTDGRCTAYHDLGPSGLPITIGFGTTYYLPNTAATAKYGARPVQMGDILTRSEAEECFAAVMDERENLVQERLKAPVTQAMYDALISFYYNLYPRTWPQQIDRCNAGKYEECAESFSLYIFAGGERFQGLVDRRKEEEALFRSQGLNLNASTNSIEESVSEMASSDMFPYRPLPLPWKREDPYLELGDKNDDVVELRCAMIGLGLIPKSGLVSDYYDQELKLAVEKFQGLKNLKVDAVVGDITAGAIESAIAEARDHGRSKFLTVTYYSQRDNVNESCCTCGITSAAMLLSAHNTVVTPDELYNRVGKIRGQSPDGLASIYKELGHQGKFSYTGTFAKIRSIIDAGSPVVIHGYFTRSGHIVCVVGYDRNGLVIHDPGGAWNSVPGANYSSLPKNGKNRAYSYDSLRRVGVCDEIWMSYIE